MQYKDVIEFITTKERSRKIHKCTLENINNMKSSIMLH